MSRRRLVPLLCFALLGQAATVAAEVVQRAVEGPALRVVKATTGAELHSLSTADALRTLPLAAPLRLRRMRALATGWIATGRRSTAAGEELVVVEQGGGALRELTPPTTPETAFQGWGVPLVDSGRLVGIAWLEGDEQGAMAVRVAGRRADEWVDPETVASPVAGTQTALDGAVLADGSWLLVWSAFDGTDDEIVWSVRRAGSWSTPESLHTPNSVPDIVPTVIDSPDGALAAWSRFDGGDYRLRVARLTETHWVESPWIGDRGSLFPTFLRTASGLAVLFRSEEPEQWSLVELDGRGAPVRSAALATSRLDRPAVRTRPQGVVFGWMEHSPADAEAVPEAAAPQAVIPWAYP